MQFIPRKKSGHTKGVMKYRTHENLSVKIDYISIVFDTATAEDVIMHILGLPNDILMSIRQALNTKPIKHVGRLEIFMCVVIVHCSFRMPHFLRGKNCVLSFIYHSF